MAVSAAIFIESNSSGSGADFILRARELGLLPVFVTASPERYAFLHGSLDLDLRTCDTSSEVAVTVVIDDVAAAMPIELLTTSSDFYLHTAALQARRLGLAGPNPDAIALCRDKARQAAALRAAGISVPCSATVGADCDIRSAIAQVGLPAVVKPISGTGSIGVALVETETDAIKALRHLLGTTTDVRGRPTQSGALLMSYIAGTEFSVEILDSRVFGVTRKHLGALPHFVEIGHDAPATLSPRLRAQVVHEALRAIEALGHTRGPAHVEVRANQGCVTIIEVNPRLAGGSIPSLFRHVTGLDPVLEYLRSLLGMPTGTPTAGAHGSIRFIVPEREGSFDLPKNVERLVDRFGLAEFALYRALPTEFTRCNDFRDRIGHIIAVDGDPAAAVRRAEAAVAFIQGQGDSVAGHRPHQIDAPS
ncbi:ATP-grasp domain-containing protein [Bradyrhizobium sp. SRL28]|uniref:ATP-grasp domain-containing protein n=1 Tax=Bradyrhizobium sp. SRL28 TaxID=2836178 RepID=UPI001BDED631|nr:ATP-grasp domain-containing protein [Bradyrhizobium sp. SRL28]MBT1517470.1 ATP-grasp domain-containing protein [Bradyrhizobium sp. SRL28]